jgi:nucleotide-binding universal stress UspA family protein
MTESYPRILAPLDGSQVAAQALDHAVAIATRGKGEITLLQVVPDVAAVATEAITPVAGATTYEKFSPGGDLTMIQTTWSDEAHASLQETASHLSAAGVRVKTAVVQGTPADSIMAFAKAEKFDLIVMSTHGRGGLARLIYGSVATQVLRAAPCPVLVIRAQLPER